MNKNLRDRAEKQLKQQMNLQQDLSNIHELQICQIELEMQNEELLNLSVLEKAALERYTEIYEFAPTGFFSLTRNGSICLVNLSGAHLLGYEKDKLLNCRFGIFVTNEDKPIFNTFLEQVFTTQAKQSCVLMLTTEGNSTISVQIEGKLSADKQECRAVLVDITAHKLAEQTLLDQQMKLISYAKFAALGEMAAGIAHEINNPLTIIMTKIFLIQECFKLNSINIPEINSELKNIENTVERISQIIKGLKSFSRNSDNDSMVFIKISQIISESLGLCQEKIKYQSIDLIIPNYTDVNLRCKVSALLQVFLNLLNNSIDAIEHLEIKWIKIEISSTKNTLIIKISDNGLGIPAETAKNMMLPFFSTKDVGRGTGLGLSISKGIIEEMKGQFWYELNFGHTCFHIAIPI